MRLDMEYNFRDKNYKVSKFKTFLTNELKKQEIETVYQFLLEFIQSNDFEYKDMLSILSRYIDYSHKFNVIEVKIYEFVNYNLEKYADKDKIENVLPTSNLIYQISADYSLKFIDESMEEFDISISTLFRNTLAILFSTTRTRLLITLKEIAPTGEVISALVELNLICN